MSADFTPSFGVYKETGSFKFWCQKVLPLVYDDSLSYYETLCKVVKYLNDVIANVDVLHDDVDGLRTAYIQLQNYVNSYFDNLDVQNEINKKLDDMADDGSLSALLSPIVATQIGGVVGEQIDAVVGSQIDASVGRQIDESVASQIATPTATATTAWLTEHVTPVGSAVVVDDTLTIEGAAADAKVCGDEFSRLNNALNDLMSYVNRIDTAVNIYQNTSIDTSTGAKKEQTGRTLYIVPATAGEVLYFTQCSNSIMLIGLYSDATATTFIDFAYNQGLTLWNKTWTVPSGVTYIGIVVTSAYADTAFCSTYSDYLIFAEHNKTKLSNDVYILKLENLKGQFDDEMNKVSTSSNLFDYDTLSAWGSWCNYLDGTIQSTQYTVTYAYSGYIKVKPNTNYARRCGNRGSVFFDENKTFISGVKTNNFTTPANCAYLVMNVSYTDPLCQYEMLLEQDGVIAQSDNYIPYYHDYKKHSPNVVTVGADGDYQTVLEGFRHAIARDCACVILPGTYDLVSEGISGAGYYLPKEVYGYGATLVCNLSEEDWNLSPLNVSVKSKGAKVYGLTVICTNCRYCIHDDMGSVTQPNYHNVFKDLHLIHNSEQSEVLLAPQCIGGGFGSNGFIEIDGCVFEATMRDVSYHSNTGQNKNATLWCKNSVFSHTYTSINSGTASVMNTSYVTGCLMASLPSTTPTVNTRIVEWNNELVS